MAKKTKNAKPKMRELTDWHFEPDAELSEKAGYPVKNHGHRHYKLRLAIDSDTGEIYLPVGYKWKMFLGIDPDDTAFAFVLVKDETHV